MRSRNKILSIITIATAIVIWGSNEASAANGWDTPLNGPSTTTSQTTSSVSLSLSSGTIQTNLDAANASVNPDEAGKVLSQTATITVGNTDGYTVYVSGNANLTGRNNSSHKIPSVSSNKILGNMSNEWGYYGVLGDSEASYNPSNSFKAMTTSQQSVGSGGATSSSVTKKLTLFYGARVNSSAVEDFYGNTVTLSVVAQPRTVTTTVTKFNGITTMQEMTASICSAAAVNDTARLRDTRDGKYYWVTKLLDGNCWMSQNLALDLGSTVTATYDSNPTQTFTWTVGSNGGMATSANMSGINSDTYKYAWDFGDYVMIDPITPSICVDNNTGLSVCREQFTNVDGWTASDNPNFYKENGNSPLNTTTKTYDAHYLAGNYYQWNAATAGTGGTIKDLNAAGSICPKNWKLPDATYGSMANGTFAYLLQQYGLASTYKYGDFTGTSDINNNAYNMALNPLFFVRSGEVYTNYQQFGSAGRGGYLWSSRADSNDSSMYFQLSTVDSVRPSTSTSRYQGLSLRCLVPTS